MRTKQIDAQPKRPALEEILRYSGKAREAFEKLCRAGVDREWLGPTLETLHHFPASKRKPAEVDQVRALAGKLKNLAADLDDAFNTELRKVSPSTTAVNPLSLFILKRGLVSQPPPGGEELTARMRAVAGWLERMATTFRLGNARLFRFRGIIECVRSKTKGRPHYAELAELFAAALSQAGRDAHETDRVTVQSLKELFSRRQLPSR
jgi:hypothetical protein